MIYDRTVETDPKAFLALCRGSTDERVVNAMTLLDMHVCGCIWCEMLGDRTGREPPGPRVVSAYCAAVFVKGKLDPEMAERLMVAAAEAP